MKKVILLGDSIRLIGYGDTVARNLADEFEVWQPNDNCKYAQYTLRGLYDWAEQMQGADIIHWNNGHWDIIDLYGDGPLTSVDCYVEVMVRLAKLLKQRAKVVIFATTTPILPGRTGSTDADVQVYNAAVVPKLQEMGILINDLHTALSADPHRYIRADDQVHLTDAGIAYSAQLVEQAIRSAAQA